MLYISLYRRESSAIYLKTVRIEVFRFRKVAFIHVKPVC
jgi:hypothetical protein